MEIFLKAFIWMIQVSAGAENSWCNILKLPWPFTPWHLYFRGFPGLEYPPLFSLPVDQPTGGYGLAQFLAALQREAKGVVFSGGSNTHTHIVST